ncbi:DUF3540 domain-containing protein [Mesoterricola silvestris]|nr:DUF3540 domain-containing protein [Mesoterricola silvestris]
MPEVLVASPGLRARVLFVSGGDIALEGPDGLVKARLAFSCLVRPEAGDWVLCLPSEDGEYHLLAILERPGPQAMTLAFPGDATLRTEEGDLRLASGSGITLAASGHLTCLADVAVHQSREAVLACDEVIAEGRSLQAHFHSISVLGRICRTLVQHLFHQARTYIRRTEDLDQVEGRQLLRRSKGLYSVGSEHTVLLSAKDTRIDGERIHMG